MTKKRYNIIMITVDGGRLDRLQNCKNFNNWVNKGTFFSNIITYGVQTVTSMHATLTGLYGNVNGADNYFGSALFRKNSCKTLAQYLKNAGFHTVADTINEIVMPEQGFDKFMIHDEHKDDLAAKHKDLIKEISEGSENFFLYLHYSNIHTGMVKTVLKQYDDFDKNYFNNKTKNLENYDQYVKDADKYLGKILKTCEELDVFKNTAVIILSDHGSSTGEKIGEIGYGRYCYDYTLKSFSIFVQPDIFPVKEVKKLGRTVDILPTILDFSDIPEENEKYKKLQGKSLLPLMDQEPDERIAFSESAGLVKPYPSKEKPLLKAVRTKEWKLIYNSKTKEKELYNILEDPSERKNLIETNLPIYKTLFKELIKLSPEVLG